MELERAALDSHAADALVVEQDVERQFDDALDFGCVRLPTRLEIGGGNPGRDAEDVHA